MWIWVKKHEIKYQKDRESINLFSEIDGNLSVEVKWFSKTCKMYICYICSKECHRQKNGCELQKGKLKYFSYQKGMQIENICEFRAPRHSNESSMIRLIINTL